MILGSGTLTTVSGTFAGTISGAGGLTKSGHNTLILAGSNTYSGATNINFGTLQLGANNAISSPLTVAGGATFNLNNFSDSLSALSGSGAVTLGTGSLTLQSGTFGGTISGSGALVKNGAGTFVLNGATQTTGTTTINGGIFDLENTSALAAVVVNSGAELQVGVTAASTPLVLSGSGTTGAGALRDLTATASWSGPISLAANTTIGSDAGSLTLSGSLSAGINLLTITGSGNVAITGKFSGSGGLAKNGAGTLTLSASNSYSGATTINAGALSLQSSRGLGATSGVTVAAGAALQLSSASGVIVPSLPLTLTGSGNGGTGALYNVSGPNVWLGPVTLASDVTIGVAQPADTLQLSGAISETGGSRALIKSGSGTLILAAVNTYTGATNITAGTLQAGASNILSGSSAMNISSGALFEMSDDDQTLASLSGAGNIDTGGGAVGAQPHRGRQ